MFSHLTIKGQLLNNVFTEKLNENTGEMERKNTLHFIMNNQKGVEPVKVKDSKCLYRDLEINKIHEIPIRVTSSNMGVTTYEVAENIK